MKYESNVIPFRRKPKAPKLFPTEGERLKEMKALIDESLERCYEVIRITMTKETKRDMREIAKLLEEARRKHGNRLRLLGL